jgi:hypothetical protein
MNFDVFYEGDETMYTIADLKPLTKYKLKLRMDLTKNYDCNM